MVLSARILSHVRDVNTFRHVGQAEWNEGDTTDLYIQLVDVTLDRAAEGYSPSGRRYVPASGATLSVVVSNIDGDKKVTRTATQPFSGDGSIWKVQIMGTDKVRGTANLLLTLTEGSVTSKAFVAAAVRIHPVTA